MFLNKNFLFTFQPVTYNQANTSLYVYWEGYGDDVSDIATYEVSIWRNKSCSVDAESEMVVSWITLSNNYTDYSFIDLSLNVSFSCAMKHCNGLIHRNMTLN